MHRAILPALLAVGAIVALPARAEHHEHAAMNATNGPAAPQALVEGVVKKVDVARGRLSVAHGAASSGMPAMTMSFKLKEAAWIDRVKEGSRIRFATETIDGAMTIVRLEVLD